jgi:hypothetical protein
MHRTEVAVGGRKEPCHLWLVVESGKTLFCAVTGYLMLSKNLLFIFSVTIVYCGYIFQKESSSFKAIFRSIVVLNDRVSVICFKNSSSEENRGVLQARHTFSIKDS